MATRQKMARSREDHQGRGQRPEPKGPAARVEISGNSIKIHDLDVTGPAFEAASACVARGEEVEAIVREMLNLGGQMLLHGASQATVDSVSAEVDRLIDAVAIAAAEELPKSLEEPLQHVDAIIAEHFDGKRKDSIQQQLVDAFEAASAGQQKSLISALLDESGPLGVLKAELASKLQFMVSRQDELLTKISAVGEQMVGAARLKEEKERGTAKGVTYEQQVVDFVESAFRPFEDIVESTGTDSGSDGGKCGDCVVSLKPTDTAGEDIRIVVEAKDRSLSVRRALDELDRAMSNREATVGIMVFAKGEQAPTRGHPLRIYPGNRLVAVFHPEDGDSLALEVACELARGLAIAAVDHSRRDVDSDGMSEDLERLATVIDDARTIKRGLKAAYKGLDQADGSYEKLRNEALALVSELQTKLS